MPSWWPFKKTSQQFDMESSSRRPDSECFFVITPIFNPAGYQSRYNLYHQFAQHMEESKAQLVTIECIFPSLDQHEFQVTKSTNPNHIQIKSKSVYWMKENLINIAASHLPPHAKWVCWLDADIFFHDKNWVNLAIKSLKKYAVVQMFEKANFLGPPEGKSKVLRSDYSFGYSVVHGKVIDQSRYDEWYPHPGYGWAMGINAFKGMGGLPEYDIVGSGDLHFAFSLINRVSNTLESDLNSAYKEMIVSHSEKTFRILEAGSTSEKKKLVGYVPVTLSHNWHGSRKDRQYVDRWKILIFHDFNLMSDTIKLDNGLLELNEYKSGLQKDIIDHFLMRAEDDTDTCDKEDFNKKDKKKKNGGMNKGLHGNRRDSWGDNRSSRDDAANAVVFSQGHNDDWGPSCYDHEGVGYCNDYGGSVQCTSQY